MVKDSYFQLFNSAMPQLDHSNQIRQLEIITTIGPESISKNVISSLYQAGATSFRINLSHSSTMLLEHYFDTIIDSGMQPSLDTQGAQIRVCNILSKKEFKENQLLTISINNNKSKSKFDFAFNHSEILDQLNPGDKIRIDFDGLIIQVKEVDKINKCILANTINKGSVSPNKAVDVIGKKISLKPLTKFDIESIIKYHKKIESLYLSFVNCSEDVIQALELMKYKKNNNLPKIIAKIETRLGILNLESILPYVDGILIDRGDLSREISISRIPSATRFIVEICKQYAVPCYVATNVLDTMIRNTLPSRSEVSDIYNLFCLGVSGIVLAAEVAIGKYPIECVHVVRHMYETFKAEQNSTLFLSLNSADFGSLPVSLRNWL